MPLGGYTQAHCNCIVIPISIGDCSTATNKATRARQRL